MKNIILTLKILVALAVLVLSLVSCQSIQPAETMTITRSVTATQTVVLPPLTVTVTASPTSTTGLPPGVIAITAAELLSATTNSHAFILTYDSHILRVTGIVRNIDASGDEQLLLSDSLDSLMWIWCSFPDPSVVASLIQGQTVTVQGLCNGTDRSDGTGNPYLIKCYLVQ